jgi:hypothetical protein
MSRNFDRANSYPLHWPDGFPTTSRRESSRFDTSLFKALENVQKSLSAFARDSGKKMTDIIVSSNYSLTDTKPDQPGVAVYFTWDGERTCIPVDRYLLVQDNLQAIYHCIEAKRTMLRHGGINLVKAAFRGYAALPSPAVDDWMAVLGASNADSLADVKKKYLAAIRKAHPDAGGSDERAAIVNAAWERAQGVLA